MPAELVVMTAEMVGDKFKVYRNAIDEIDDIPRHGVLFIIISCVDPVRPRLNGRRRLYEAHSKDRYTLIVRKNNVMLAGWDDGQFEWKGLADPWAEASTVKPDHLPLAHPAITFEGVQIAPDEWKKAIKQFMDEMH